MSHMMSILTNTENTSHTLNTYSHLMHTHMHTYRHAPTHTPTPSCVTDTHSHTLTQADIHIDVQKDLNTSIPKYICTLSFYKAVAVIPGNT